MDLQEAIDQVENIGDDVVSHMYQIKGDQCGLDVRAGYRLYINNEAIGVDKGSRGSLEYYGGFEYVQADDKVEIGDYVFYLIDSDRVRDHIERWMETYEFPED